MVKKKTGVAPGYLHGYTPDEQERLYKQARFLEPSVYETIDLRKQSRCLEVGCGVGAQTEILIERFPNLTVTGIDSSKAQVARARKHLSRPVSQGKVRFDVGDALHLPYRENTFDSAFVCWFLEHVQEPIGILREIRRVLQAGSIIYCTEVQNATLYLHPYSPATLQYWFAFNDHQWSIKGDPFVGAKLANYLLAAGYQNVTTHVMNYFYDNRTPKRRAEFIEYWTRLLLSGAPGLIEAGRVDRKTVEAMTRELALLKTDPDSVFFYSAIQARAEAY
ncbi:MAG: class I SAM-dependent methyltransferase [Bdellovibrionota bacterium]